MELRKITRNDLDSLVKNRVEFVSSIRMIEDLDGFEKATKAYFEKYLETEELIGYVFVEDGKICSVALLSISFSMPRPSSPNGKVGELLNVYTLSEYRRRGLAQKVIEQIIKAAKEEGVSTISLDYTKDGYPLYVHLGFETLDNKMRLRL